MNIRLIRKSIIALGLSLVVWSGIQSEAQAEDGASQLARHGMKVTQLRYKTLPRAGGTNFPGRWHGKFVRVRATCSGFSSGFLFRHQVAMQGNRVAIATTHDGILTGISRDGGRKLQASRRYFRGAVLVDAALQYQNLKGSTVGIGLGIVLTYGANRCVLSYGAVGIRA